MVEAADEALAQAAARAPVRRGGAGSCARAVERRAAGARRPADGVGRRSLEAMCGIIGATGGDEVLDVLLEGLERLEYRGYDSAGVALQSDGAPVAGPGRHRHPLARGPPQGGRGRPRRRWRPASATPAGPPTATPPRPTPTPSSTAPATWPSSTTASSRTGASWPHELRDEGHVFASDTDTEVIAHLVEARARRAGRRWPTRCAATLREVRGAFALAVDRAPPSRAPSWPARRVSPLVIGMGDGDSGEGLLASDIPALLGPDPALLGARRRPGGGAAARLDAGHDPARQGGRAHRAARRLGPRGGREGRLPRLHGQGDPRAAPGHRRHPARPAAARRHGRARRAAHHRRRAAPGRQGLHRGLRVELPRRHGGQVRHRAPGPGCPPRSTSPRSSATATPCSTSAPSWSG